MAQRDGLADAHGVRGRHHLAAVASRRGGEHIWYLPRAYELTPQHVILLQARVAGITAECVALPTPEGHMENG